MNSAAEQPQVIEQTVKMPISDYKKMMETHELVKSLVKNITGDKWLNSKEAAKYIKKSVTHLNNRLADQIGYSKAGREFLFRREDLDAWLMRHYKQAKD